MGTLTLAVGSTSDSVTVQADATPVQTESAERSGDIDTHEIGALLARGLQFNGLLRGLPGISGAVDPTTPGGAYAPYGSINGTRWSATIPTLDGVGASDPSSQGQLMATSATDSLSEVNVKMSNFQAEYGQSGGAIINLTTKSGTKQFHGDLYTYFRNEDLNANDYFNNFNGIARPRYRYIIGGGSVGGPVFIPGKFNTGQEQNLFLFQRSVLPPEYSWRADTGHGAYGAGTRGQFFSELYGGRRSDSRIRPGQQDPLSGQHRPAEPDQRLRAETC